MQALVVYDSRLGHTRLVAEAIGKVLSKEFVTRVVEAAEAGSLAASGADLLVIGGPTQAHGLSEPMRTLLDELKPGSLARRAVATFDTRLHMPRWLSGSAATAIAGRLQRAGAEQVLPPESFFVDRTKENPLRAGELERAPDWAEKLLAAALTRTPSHQTAL